jgi:hypothetical protein
MRLWIDAKSIGAVLEQISKCVQVLQLAGHHEIEDHAYG